MALILRQTIKPAGDFPAVEAEDVLMPDGTRLSEFEGGGSLDIVTYDLASMGVPAIPVNGDNLQLEMDTTEVREAMQTSILKVVINLEYSGLAFSNVLVMFLPNSNVSYVNIIGFVFRVMFNVNETGITIGATLSTDVPFTGVSYNDKILQVVDGKPAWVSVADSAVKTYIDEYISSALEGDY